jgi:hypothetical protein
VMNLLEVVCLALGIHDSLVLVVGSRGGASFDCLGTTSAVRDHQNLLLKFRRQVDSVEERRVGSRNTITNTLKAL